MSATCSCTKQASEQSSAAAGFPAFLERTEALFGPDMLKVLGNARVAIAGLGGVGGAILPPLVRMGVGKFHIADPGIFDTPDMNRQTAATRATLGKNKAEVYAEFIRSVNPDADVGVFSSGVTDDNIGAFLEGADIVVDALDLRVPSALRVRLGDQAREQGIYNVSSPIIAFGTAVAVAAPDGLPMSAFLEVVERVRSRGRLPNHFRDYFLASHLDIMEQRMVERRMVPTVAIAPGLSASIACTEILMVLGKGVLPGWRPPVCLPELFLVDLARMSYRVAHLDDVKE